MMDLLTKRFCSSRKDVRLGLVAAPMAVLGLGSSVLTGNEDLFGVRVSSQDQRVLLVFAVGVLALTVFKAITSWK